MVDVYKRHVSSVYMSKMVDSRPITSLSAGLSGMAAGVSVTQGSGGRPGNDGATIRVRGQGTLNNSDPLVVIDGVPGSMNDINPQDVESISVLKDAASSAIYGSRAANGVIPVSYTHLSTLALTLLNSATALSSWLFSL